MAFVVLALVLIAVLWVVLSFKIAITVADLFFPGMNAKNFAMYVAILVLWIGVPIATIAELCN